ncbi:MAG TPA: hypothetical protein VK742_21495 [Candidatus Sulfotelmatobacter sp.]|jgi:hypothetical protein|nr:hypothetical protein [Candidatus Sulfotelmatobacter sp.]
MRHLLQPRTMNRAILAAAGSTLACWPQFVLWDTKHFPLYYLLASAFFCGIVLWSFVFAWHTPYTGRPIFTDKFDPKLFSVVTLAGIILSTACKFWLDPKLKMAFPEDYPTDLLHWFAEVLFVFAFGQLFLTFAPCDWLMRLCRNRPVTVVLTAAFGASVTAMKMQPHAGEISTEVFTYLLTGRFLGALLAVLFYLRGGMVLAWWWALLFELRLLPGW